MWGIRSNNMKKIFKYISILLALLLVLPTLLASCGKTGGKDKINIVCTAFVQYDFVMNIIGENRGKFEVTYLLESGTDMHSYSNLISVSDKVKILSSDLFICIGGSSEKWIDDLLGSEKSKEINTLKLIDCVGELVCTSDDDHESHGHTHAHECDEHIWLSPKRAIMMCDAICGEISLLDSKNAEMYAENNVKYKEKLEKLDNDFESMISSAKTKYLLFADRFPFVYLTNDYGIDYSAAFVGCSTETNATYETVAKLVKDIKDKNIKNLIVLENGKTAIADTLISESGRNDITVLSVVSMQNVSKKDINSGLSYISAMQENLENFGKAMN
ncbi:MAG: zinc ABC transporter substrate-binding protein [Ruminococcaceae bacterium]|nr:zinc ABC transporter substrate-binding protein [Oscillospiraceae bacterium]